MAWFREQWANLWGSGDQSTFNVAGITDHISSAAEIVGDIFKLIFANPYFLLIMSFSVLSAAVTVFRRLRRSIR